MALAGFAYSCMVVSSFSRAQQKVLDMGYPNDMNTSTMISGTSKIFLENHIINFIKPPFVSAALSYDCTKRNF